MTSYLAQLSDRTVINATGRSNAFGSAAAQAVIDRETARRLAWALFRQFEHQKIRVPLFWGMTWTVRLGDLRPLWERLFGPEVGTPELELPPPDLAA